MWNVLLKQNFIHELSELGISGITVFTMASGSQPEERHIIEIFHQAIGGIFFEFLWLFNLTHFELWNTDQHQNLY